MKISRIMAALPITAALCVALPTTSEAQGWVWRAGKWVYEVAKDSRMLAPGAGAAVGSTGAIMLFGGNAKAAEEARACFSDVGCRRSLGLSPQPPSTSGMLNVGTPEEQERFLRRFNAAPPSGSAAKRLLEQSR